MAALMLDVDLSAKRLPGGRLLLRDIAFRLVAGRVLTIAGPSGCGKSTLLGVIAGLDPDYQGRVTWKGNPRVGMVFQTPRLLPWRSALDNVALALGGGAAVRPAARSALQSVGLAEAVDVYPSRLSVGMARRVALARALAIEPDLLLLDEAFVSLDGEAAAAMRALVAAEVTRRGMAVLMVTHDLRDAEEMGGTVLRLGGSPTHLIAIDEILARPAGARLRDAPGSCPP